MAQSIAITGQGIICAIGVDCDSVYASLLNGKSGISDIKYLKSGHKALPVGEVKMSDEELKSILGIAADKDISRTSLLGAYALKQALEAASIDVSESGNRRMVFISGTTVGGMDVTERHYSEMLANKEAAAYLANHDCGSNTDEIADLCGLNAKNITISTACSSALNAIILGCRLLLADEADIVIAGGSEALSKFHLNGFNSLMILDQEPCRPFDKNRQGLNLGEGAAYVVLEREADAGKRSIVPLAFIGGYGNRCDAFHQTATSENGEGAFLAMSDALDCGGIAPVEIDYINAHGTGTPDNDRSESKAIIRLFSESHPPVSSTKAFTGHTTSASGSIETVISILALHHNFLPSNLRWRNPDPGCIIPSASHNKKINKILCNSFGFGGNDSALIISKDPVSLGVIHESPTLEVSPVMEITDAGELTEIKKYVAPMEARRMSMIMKAAIITSMKALEEAGIERPDAIVVGTCFGMLEQGEKILNHIEQQGESGLSPTLFMQSTHNTIAGFLATKYKCHGYNITYSQGEDSWQLALDDAKRLISEGKARHVLVGVHDFCPQHFREIFGKAGLLIPPELISRSAIVSQKKGGGSDE